MFNLKYKKEKVTKNVKKKMTDVNSQVFSPACRDESWNF